MSKKNVDLFIKHLEEENLTKINPRAFTPKEMTMFGDMRGFCFSIDDLCKKIDEINNFPDEELGMMEKIWKNRQHLK